MDYFEKKMCERLAMPTGDRNHREDEELFYASYGQSTAAFANLRRWWASWTFAPSVTAAPAPKRTRVLG